MPQLTEPLPNPPLRTRAGIRRRRRTPGSIPTTAASTSSSTTSGRHPPRPHPHRHQPRPRRRTGASRRCQRARYRRRRDRRPRRLRDLVRAQPASARPPPLRHRPQYPESTPACWRCSRAWTTASRSAKRAISMCRWSPAILSSRRLGAAARQRIARLSAAGRSRPGHPLELPAADAGLEDRAGAGHGQHGRHQAGALHAADRPALRRDHRRSRLAAGRGQHRHRRRRKRARRWWPIDDLDKIAFTGSTASGALSGARPPAKASS